jgi:hypothetical protein
MRMRARIATSTLGLVLLAAMLTAQPQAPQRPQFLVLSVIDVKPDMMAEFGELQAQTMKAQQKGGQAWRETWNVMQFGNPHRVGVLRPLTSFSELDGQSFTIKGAGAEQARVINERARRMIVAQQIYALRARPELGYGTRPAQPNLAVFSTVTIVPGRSTDFENIVKTDIVPAWKKAGEPYLGVSQVVLGGETNRYLMLTLVGDFAGLDKGHPMLRALGPENFAKFDQKLAGIVAKIESEVVRFNAALSFRAGTSPPSR